MYLLECGECGSSGLKSMIVWQFLCGVVGWYGTRKFSFFFLKEAMSRVSCVMLLPLNTCCVFSSCIISQSCSFQADIICNRFGAEYLCFSLLETCLKWLRILPEYHINTLRPRGILQNNPCSHFISKALEILLEQYFLMIVRRALLFMRELRKLLIVYRPRKATHPLKALGL